MKISSNRSASPGHTATSAQISGSLQAKKYKGYIRIHIGLKQLHFSFILTLIDGCLMEEILWIKQ
jgi:hypothetical protein